MAEQIPQELFYTWISEFINQNDIHDFTGHEAAFAVYIAEKACEWQRERDALICEKLEHGTTLSHAGQSIWEIATLECADAIRKGGE